MDECTLPGSDEGSSRSAVPSASNSPSPPLDNSSSLPLDNSSSSPSGNSSLPSANSPSLPLGNSISLPLGTSSSLPLGNHLSLPLGNSPSLPLGNPQSLPTDKSQSQALTNSPSQLGMTLSPTFPAFRGNFPGLTSTPHLFSRATLLQNTSLFHTASRSMHASNVERFALLRVMSDHLAALETRDTDSRTVQKRASVWEEITEKFNASTTVKRNRHQVQTLYKNMKAKAKKYQSRCLDPHNSGLERDHVSEMLLGMLNDEYQQRRTVMHQAAIMAFREDSPSDDFKDHSIARDVSQFLKQEMHEATEVDSSAALSPQTSVCSPNSGAGDSTSSSGRGAASSQSQKTETTPDDGRKIPTNDRKKGTDHSPRSATPSTEYIAMKEGPFTIDDLPPRPEPVRLQELCYAQYLAQSQNSMKRVMRRSREDSDQSINNESYDTPSQPNKKRKNNLECQQMIGTALETDKEQTAENNSSNKKNNISGEKPTLTSQFPPNFCCSGLHDEFLKMKQKEHKLKMQILEQELEAAREKRTEEKEYRKIEHEMRLHILQKGSSSEEQEPRTNIDSNSKISS